MMLIASQDLKAATVRLTSTSAAATPACTEAGASRGHGGPSTAASLCCRSATTGGRRQATSAAVLQEQQVRISEVSSVGGAKEKKLEYTYAHSWHTGPAPWLRSPEKTPQTFRFWGEKG